MYQHIVINTNDWDYFQGKNPTDDYLETMMSEAPGPVNFTMFLTMFGEKLNGTDPEDVIRNAFACFDEDGTGEFMFTRKMCNALCAGVSHQCCQDVLLLFCPKFTKGIGF